MDIRSDPPVRTPSRLHVILFAAILWAATASAQEFPQGYVGTLTATPAAAVVGEPVTFEGTGFEPGSELELVWLSYDLAWDLGEADGAYDGTFLGLGDREPRETSLATVAVDAAGAFETVIAIPEDFGGTRNVRVRQDDVDLNQVGLFIRADMRLSPESGPLGSDITVRITGIDSGQPMVWYLLSYDHDITGFVSAVTTQGTAEFVIPAVGAVGPHLVRLEDSPFGQPYLPLDTSPWAHLGVPSRTFVVTDGEPVLPLPLAEQVLPSQPGQEPDTDGARLWLDPWKAPVGASARVQGKGFEPGIELQLGMSNMVGSRVTDSGFSAVDENLMTITVADDGSFSAPFTIPDTLGGLHDVWARPMGQPTDAELAKTRMHVLPLALELETVQVRYGDTLRLHLKGIGWSQTENIFGISIDNAYIGYACGFSTNGDVQVPIEVSWQPGWHYIDVYPSFYRNKAYSEVDEAPFLFRHSLLSWEDHPSGFHFRFAFEVLPPEG